jgi:hypothetical protein
LSQDLPSVKGVFGLCRSKMRMSYLGKVEMSC